MSELTVYPDMEQRSEAWYAARCGIVTASAVGALISIGPPHPTTVDCPSCGAIPDEPCLSAGRKVPTPIKTIHAERSAAVSSQPPVYSPASNDTSRGLLAVLVAERITGEVEPTFTNDDMFRGIMHEPIARDLYGQHYAPAVECGFMVREGSGWKLGYSPDGLVGDDGLLEIKCPRAKAHVQTILADEVPPQYMAQCQAGLFVSGREWLDFVSFRAGLPLYIKRVLPDQRWHDAIAEAVAAFERAAEAMTDDYLRKVDGLPATERVPDYYDEVVI